MKKLLILIYLVVASFMLHAQSVFSLCPVDGIFFTTNNQCAGVAPIGHIINPILRAGGGVVSLVWQISGVTNAASPLTGINYIPATQVFNVGPNIITFVATTATGKQEVCTYRRGVLELIKPVITCPKDTTQYTGVSNCNKIMTVTNPTTSDNCKVAWLKWERTGATVDMSKDSIFTYLSSKTFNKGITTVKYTVTDYANNTATCTFKVSVLDTIKPQLGCRGNVTVNADSARCTKSVTLLDPTFSDGCGISSLTWKLTGKTVNSSPTTGINKVGTFAFNKGVTTVAYTVKDNSGNNRTCSSTVTIVDKTRPVILNNQKDTIKASLNNGCTINIAVPKLNVWDGCDTVFTIKWKITGPVNGSGTGQVGTFGFGIGNSIIYDTAWDASGNYTTGRFNVKVSDTAAPTITCTASRSDSIQTGCSKSIALSNPVYGDNCNKNLLLTWKMTGATIDSSAKTGTNTIGSHVFNQGTTNCYYTIKDGAGISKSCQFTVKVTELTKPTITCPADQTVTTAKCTDTVTGAKPIFSDNCKVSSLRWILSGATTGSAPVSGINYLGNITLKRGTTSVTYRVTDASGNFTSCLQKIVVSGPSPCQTFAKPAISTLTGDFKVKLLSNPSNRFFNLNVSDLNNQPAEVVVYSYQGQKIDQFKIRNTQSLLFGEKYVSGSYYIVIRQGSLQKTFTAIKL